MISGEQLDKSVNIMKEHRTNLENVLSEYFHDQELAPGEASALLRILAAECEWIAVNTREAKT